MSGKARKLTVFTEPWRDDESPDAILVEANPGLDMVELRIATGNVTVVYSMRRTDALKVSAAIIEASNHVVRRRGES